MAFNITETLRQVQSHAAASARFSQTQLGEPFDAPVGAALLASVSMQAVSVVGLYLDGGTKEVHTVMLRIYRDVLKQPQADGETELAIAASELMQDIAEDFTLGARVREVDVAGQFGQPLAADWGHITIGSTIYRIVDIVIPIIVDDSATAAA